MHFAGANQAHATSHYGEESEAIEASSAIMVRVSFTANLQRHLVVSECVVEATTVHAALTQVFAGSPKLKSYLLDDQGRLRQHVAIFVDGVQIQDRLRLSDALSANSEIYVVQALSGG